MTKNNKDFQIYTGNFDEPIDFTDKYFFPMD